MFSLWDQTQETKSSERYIPLETSFLGLFILVMFIDTAENKQHFALFSFFENQNIFVQLNNLELNDFHLSKAESIKPYIILFQPISDWLAPHHKSASLSALEGCIVMNT